MASLFKKLNNPSFQPSKRAKYERKTTSESRGHAGRPRREIDWDMVMSLAHIHCTPEEIGAVMDIPVHTLTQRPEFPGVYKKGWEGGKKSLRRMQWEAAEKGNVIMQIFLGKQLLGQADKWVGSVGGDPNGMPLQVEMAVKPDLSKLSVEELYALKAIMSKACTKRTIETKAIEA